LNQVSEMYQLNLTTVVTETFAQTSHLVQKYCQNLQININLTGLLLKLNSNKRALQLCNLSTMVVATRVSEKQLSEERWNDDQKRLPTSFLFEEGRSIICSLKTSSLSCNTGRSINAGVKYKTTKLSCICVYCTKG
jgi:hypothetical protein